MSLHWQDFFSSISGHRQMMQSPQVLRKPKKQYIYPSRSRLNVKFSYSAFEYREFDRHEKAEIEEQEYVEAALSPNGAAQDGERLAGKPAVTKAHREASHRDTELLMEMKRNDYVGELQHRFPNLPHPSLRPCATARRLRKR